MIRNLDKLAGLKEVELLSIREHPYKLKETIIVSSGIIKNYDYITYDTCEKTILFLKATGKGMLKIIARLPRESFVKIMSINDEVKILVD